MKPKALKKLLLPLTFLLVVSVFVTIEHIGVTRVAAETSSSLSSQTWEEALTQTNETCLVLTNTVSDAHPEALSQMEAVLQGMRIGYKTVDVQDIAVVDLHTYQTLVFTFSDLDPLEEKIDELLAWVTGGGRVLFMLPPSLGLVYNEIQEHLGILDASSLVVVEELSVSPDFMIGAEDTILTISAPYRSSLNVVLDDQCTVYMQSEPDGLPLLWERTCGDGKFVISNHGQTSKAARGFLSAAYSMLEDVCVYPVINASCFFIDDFPSPIPSGKSESIEEDYGRSIASFYANVWWPDVLALAEQYGVKYSGMIIEQYSDVTDGTPLRNMSYIDYQYYGNMLINAGGELGYHGYNHMPLYTDAEYEGEYETYKNWESVEAMTASIQELIDFSEEVFPGLEMISYVPPSNLLSAEGRSVLVSFPKIKIIASLYFSSAESGALVESLTYEQEFMVSEDGIVEVPRIISGLEITEYMEFASFSELNFHYVNSHFMHPDDVLSDDRNGENNWESLKASYAEYMEWLYSSAPNIRNATVSEAAAAVAQYDLLVVQRSLNNGVLKLNLDGFNEEAYFLLRINEGTFTGEIEGASMEEIAANLYLLHATQDEITIGIEETN